MPTQKKKVIMLEFNELCPPLMEKFIANGHLPKFKRLQSLSQCYVTDAQEKTENLEPWIQWPTVHTGLSFDQHGIFHLGDADKLEADSIWDILSRQGLSTWICGSMNANYDKQVLKGKVLPDPWSIGVEPSHKELEPYYRFVRANVQEHTNDTFKLEKKDYLDFIRFMFTHGLSVGTIYCIAKQLVAEKINPAVRWKRALLMDRMQWDIFKYEFKKNKPSFSTFFLNSTAHFQHKFWRYMEPDKFNVDLPKKDIDKYGDAILEGYKNMDRLVGEALKLKDKDTAIVFCTALSQQPYKDLNEKRFYRPYDFQRMIDVFDLKGVKEISPVMSEQFHIICESESAAKSVAEHLSGFTLHGDTMFTISVDGANVFSGCQIHSKLEEDINIYHNGKEVIKLYDLFYLADNVKSGMHNPNGLFWITSENKENVAEKTIPLTQVMHVVLNEFKGSISAEQVV